MHELGSVLHRCRALSVAMILLSCPLGIAQELAAPVKPRDKEPIKESPEAMEFTKRLLDFIHKRSEDPVFDSNALFALSADKLKMPPGAERDRHIAKRKAAFDESGVVHSFRDFVSAGGSIAFLRFRNRDETTVAVFRAVTAPGAVVYFECKLGEKGPDGAIRAVDVYQFTDSAWLSDSDVAAHIKAKAGRDPLVLQALFPGIDLTKESASQCYQLMKSNLTQNWLAVLAAFATLPESLQRNKECLLLRFRAASRLRRQAEIDWTLDRLIELHGKDPVVALLSIDHLVKRGDLEKVFAAIDLADRAVGGDPYLDFMRAAISLNAGKAEAALQHAKSAIDREPSLVRTHWILAKAAARTHDYSTAVTSLRLLVSVKLTTFEEIEQHRDFSDLIASPEFKAWKAESEAKK